MNCYVGCSPYMKSPLNTIPGNQEQCAAECEASYKGRSLEYVDDDKEDDISEVQRVGQSGEGPLHVIVDDDDDDDEDEDEELQLKDKGEVDNDCKSNENENDQDLL
eukprot:CAMPEP_0202711600 /NCGR_PEP_ID=MMETSP1385-20130828/23353_1 /ASSEMBLY_ACC=CAM_ASM_000861 /TAXON_ID=933848 /ORGANISM="Elphidium margaritaceum" /LENGTH=105 /DNA_ID=CAMNT_0049371357 /DNA_START=533 /DNA_END=850 /DNA_ORIENTATION=+